MRDRSFVAKCWHSLAWFNLRHPVDLLKKQLVLVVKTVYFTRSLPRSKHGYQLVKGTK